MAFDVEAARADGYTDEEIQRYLETKDQPLPAEQPRDRSEEESAIYKGMGLKAAEIGLEAYGAKKLLIDPALKMLRGPVAPAPVQDPGASQRIMQQAMGRPGVATMPAAAAPPMPAPTMTPAVQPAPAAPQPSIMQRGMDYARQMQQIAAQRVIPAAGALARGSVGPGMALYSGGLNTGEAEELRRRQAMPNPYAR